MEEFVGYIKGKKLGSCVGKSSCSSEMVTQVTEFEKYK